MRERLKEKMKLAALEKELSKESFSKKASKKNGHKAKKRRSRDSTSSDSDDSSSTSSDTYSDSSSEEERQKRKKRSHKKKKKSSSTPRRSPSRRNHKKSARDQEMLNLARRIREADERAVLLAVLKEVSFEISGEDVEIINAIVDSLPRFAKFLTKNELNSRLENVTLSFDPRRSIFALSRKLDAKLPEAFIVVRWFRRILEEKLRSCLEASVSLDPNDDFQQQSYSEMAISLSSLPDRIANCRLTATSSEDADDVNDCIRSFEDVVVTSLKSTLSKAHEDLGRADVVNLRTIAQIIMVSRNLRLSGNSTLLSTIFHWLCSQTPSDPKWDRVSQRIFTDEGYGIREFEAMVVGLVLEAENSDQLMRVFGYSIQKSPTLQRICTKKLLFQRNLPVPALIALMDFIRRAAGKDVLLSVLDTTISIWSGAAFVKYTPSEQQKHISRVFLLVIRMISESKFEIDWSLKMVQVISGVQTRMESADTMIRQSGMFIGEKLSGLAEKNLEAKNDDKKRLKFDYEEDGWTKEMRRLYEENLQESKEAEKMEEEPQPSTSYSTLPEKLKDVKIDQSRQLDSDDDEDFPVYEVPEEERRFVKGTDGKEPERRGPPPNYISDAFERLLEKEKYEIFEASLNALESMIKRKALGFSNIARQLATRLIFLDDSFGTPNFEETRKKCTVGCCVQMPQIVPDLVNLMFSSDCNMSRRYLILECVHTAAKELADFGATPTKIVKNDVQNIPEWRKIVDERIKSKTKRFGANNQSGAANLKVNRLGEVSKYFFYPLLVHSTGEHLSLRGKDSTLFARVIFVAADIFQNSGMVASSPRMASKLIEYTASLRYHDDAWVRVSVLYAHWAIVETLNREVFLAIFGDRINDWAIWAISVVENVDSEEGERKIAAPFAAALLAKSKEQGE
ncbi:unnamed protein product [Caenorhabditis auriculariae]|uniref:Telomere length regulation protein TEL2 homolog n=1 Tax=Caenorhabditis auriculariae TaxID=2777116 RepID=A0A8S1HQQ9_9PELO|nr:unnamed protein product [Caenorhabditis auriculariae]